MNAQLEITMNQFLEQYYGDDKKQLAVQKCRWKKRMVKDPKELKGSDLTMYNLMMFASGRKEQQQESIREKEIMELSMEERIEKGIVPKSETCKDVEINFKKLIDDYIPKMKEWAKSIRKVNTYEELLEERKTARNKYNTFINEYLSVYEGLIEDDAKYEELDYFSDDISSKYIDDVYDKIYSKLPIVAIRNPITNRIIKRAYTNDEVTECMKEVVDNAQKIEIDDNDQKLKDILEDMSDEDFGKYKM